jgi:hypothetical protein
MRLHASLRRRNGTLTDGRNKGRIRKGPGSRSDVTIGYEELVDPGPKGKLEPGLSYSSTSSSRINSGFEESQRQYWERSVENKWVLSRL